MRAATVARLVVAWISVGTTFAIPGFIAETGQSLPGALSILVVLLGVIMWSAFGAVHQADLLAERLGEPRGTLLLTLSIVIIEVALIGAVMLGTDDPMLGRDTMFAVLMIVLNGVVGLGLIIGGWRYGAQAYNLEGALAYLALILPLAVIALMLPNYTETTPGGTLSIGQSVAFAMFTLVLYAVFLLLQTGRLREFFVMPGFEPAEPDHAHEPRNGVVTDVMLLLLSLLPIVLLAKQLAKILDKVLVKLHAPSALGGVIIALIVFTPEGLAAIRAVTLNRMQRTINLCLGAAASTIGLTVPVLLLIGLATGNSIVLGLSPSHMMLLALTLVLSTLTFSGTRTTALNGAMHLGVFFVYLTLIFSP